MDLTSLRSAAHRQRLVGYTGAHLAVGESAALTIGAKADALAVSNEAGERVVLPGLYTLALTDGAHEVTLPLRVTGAAAVVEKSAFKADVKLA